MISTENPRHTHTTVPVTTAADRRPLLFLLSALTVALDQLTKFLIITHVRPGEHIPVIPGFFRISHVLNTGAAFSLLADTANPDTVRFALIGFSVLATVIVAVMIWRTGREIALPTVALALILGGAVGNLYDRIVRRVVIDFLEVHIVNYHWPDFNVADSAICIGACLLILEIFRSKPPELDPAAPPL